MKRIVICCDGTWLYRSLEAHHRPIGQPDPRAAAHEELHLSVREKRQPQPDHRPDALVRYLADE